MSVTTNYPLTSRVWIYQSTRPFSQDEEPKIEASLRTFTQNWSSHGTKLKADYRLVYNQFIVILVDEEQKDASGCSIDSSVSIIRELEQKFGLSLLDRSKVAYKREDNSIGIIDFQQIKPAIEEGEITKNTIIFNNTVTTLDELVSKWELSADSSWLSRFFS